jgi:tRNA nucleotidyltransferase (CCA-adding enzyme)
MAYLPEAKTEALRAMPGAARILEAVADRPSTYLVGGAVRDLMLGFAQFDYDLMVEDSAAGLAALLAERIGGTVTLHDRFLTASFKSDDGELSVDIATARTESYPEPGSLPVVDHSDLEHDLGRRDFTVNAMALAIWHERLGELREYPDAGNDLMARVLRVTHDNSFIDDPTRLLRLLRYGARLGFTAEPHTEDLARQAVESGAPSSVSGARIRDELLDLLSERAAVVAIESMYALGLDRALHPKFDADEYVVSRAMLELTPEMRQELVLLALCCRAMDADELKLWLQHLQLPRESAAVVREAVANGPGLLARIADGASVGDERPETVAFALALPAGDAGAADQAREWLAARPETVA